MWNKLKIAIEIISVVKNWPKVFLVKVGFLRSTEVYFRNGYKLAFALTPMCMGDFIWFVYFFRDFPDGKIENGVAYFTYKKRNLKMDFGNGIVRSFYRYEWDKFLSDEALQDKTVLDFGGGFGDTIIDFWARGAKRVIGFELLPYRHALAVKNIRLNGASGSCRTVNAAVGGKSAEITVNPQQVSSEYYSELASIAKFGKHIVKIPVITLSDIVREYQVEQESVIKSDMQGGEYEVFMNTPDEILNKFSLIVIRSYYQRDGRMQELKNRLESAGFKCEYYKPQKWGCGYLVAHQSMVLR